ncbi:hypothetical protein GNP44_15720 [Aliivibrio fischeri]|uniref:hypothetical protein n=1 Tax=Aliivibrio fischeri TaxID=668 RepID=UPI0012D92E92|nr:hypothetical protein [Aliivibrio fischeri]MUK31520.1 hypothetical protein [Aliivibrio fischeri]
MHDKENELELERELHELPIIYQWEIIRCDFGNTLRWVISIGLPFFGYSFLLLLIQDMDAAPVLFLIGLIMIFVIRYLFLSDNQYCYFLTQKGIHFTIEQVIPEIAYKVMRGFAWFGVAVSFLAVTIIGPMAFVGAGACALLSFKMTGFESKISKSYILFSDEYTLFDIRKEDTFAIISHPYDLYASYEWLFYFPNDREEIKKNLLSVFRKSRYIEINHPKEIDNYGPFESSENLSINNANS